MNMTPQWKVPPDCISNAGAVSVYLTYKYPGAVFILGVPGNRLIHPKIGLPLIQLVDQLHLRQWAENRERTCFSAPGWHPAFTVYTLQTHTWWSLSSLTSEVYYLSQQESSIYSDMLRLSPIYWQEDWQCCISTGIHMKNPLSNVNMKLLLLSTLVVVLQFTDLNLSRSHSLCFP